MKKDIRVAAVVCQSMIGRTENNLDKMKTWIKAAKKEKAEIVCFPESNITGYHVRKAAAAAAEPMDGARVKAAVQMAVDHDIAVIAGFIERGENGRLFSTGVACDKTGMLGAYRKAHLGPPEKKIFSHADKIGPLFEINGFRFGIQLCYDAHFPELTTHMAAGGAHAIFILHASPGKSADEKIKSWMRHLPARAYDNGLFVITVNPVGDNGCGLYFPGAAIAFSPLGKIIASHAGHRETMLVVDLSAKMLADVRGHKMRYFFPNRRPELYRKNS